MAQPLLPQLVALAPAFGTALGLSLLLTPLVRSLAVRYGWVSRPVEDRWGRRVIARLGGVAMFASFVTAVLLWVPLTPPVTSLLVGGGLVFLLGLLDDIRRMPPYTKLVAQLLIGSLVVLGGIRITLVEWAWLAVPLSILWFVLVMNAFNLLDNMDGLSAGVGAIAAGVCAVHAVLGGQGTVASLAAVVSGMCLGFLRSNFPPAKIFMGDSGSHLLGLGLAALALMGSWRHSTQLLSVLAVPTLVLAVPIFDTCFVTIQRLAHRQHPFAGGTDHVSHRLAILGLTVQQTVLALYALSLCVGVLSLVSANLRLLPALALWLSVFTGLILCGLYLGKVNVYRLAPRPAEATGEWPKPPTLISTMLLHKRRLLEVLVDFCLISSMYVFAHLLRFEGALSRDLQQLIVKSLPIILVVKLASFAAHRLYRGAWRYLGLSDVITIFKAVTVGSVVSALVLLYVWRFEGFSRAVLIIDGMLTFLAVGGSRVVERLLDEWITRASAQGAPVVIIGAGDSGARVARLLRDEEPPSRRVVAFLDDDPRTWGSRIHGVAVVGGRDRLGELIQRAGAREVLVAMSDPPGELLQDVRRQCEPRGVAWTVVTAGITHAA
jgi:UDP-GlcNAc:undecaprenyl-phosphate GlcNAc-1-phosphate transferase